MSKNKVRRKDVSIRYSLHRVVKARKVSRGILISLISLVMFTMVVMIK